MEGFLFGSVQETCGPNPTSTTGKQEPAPLPAQSSGLKRSSLELHRVHAETTFTGEAWGLLTCQGTDLHRDPGDALLEHP